MSLLQNNSAVKAPTVTEKSKINKMRYVLGISECYYEPAVYIQETGKITADVVSKMLKNKDTRIEECEGKSLKVMFHTGTEVKFLGFITAGDGSRELTDEDVAYILNNVEAEEIVQAITADELVDMF